MKKMTVIGDPRLKIQLSETIQAKLKEAAKKNKRRVQDEFILRIAASFELNEQYESLQLELQQKPEISNNLSHYSQALPVEMLQEINRASGERGIGVGQEVASRLLATFIQPEKFGLESLAMKIMNTQFSMDEAMQECKQKRNGWLYLYEVEKLKLFMKFEKKLPRKIRENFVLIDVDEVMKQIKAELEEG